MAIPKYQPPKGKQADKQLVDSQYTFKGQWLPSLDPARIGPENFRALENLRYSDDGVEGVLGYSEINATALVTYTKIWNGFQLRSDRTQKTYTLIHAVNPATGQGRVYENRADITDADDFETTQLHADASVDLLGRFSDAPGGSCTYCNGEENKIYAGDETRTAGFFLVADTSHTLPEDHTERINNTLTDSANVTVIDSGDNVLRLFSFSKVLVTHYFGSAAAASYSHVALPYVLSYKTFQGIRKHADTARMASLAATLQRKLFSDNGNYGLAYHKARFESGSNLDGIELQRDI
jgi:hypothetical protein